LVKLSNIARRHFREKGVSFLKIFVSGNLYEFKIDDLLKQDALIDGFGIGTNFAVSRFAPAIEIIYKIVQYGEKRYSKPRLVNRLVTEERQLLESRITITRGTLYHDYNLGRTIC